MTFVMKCEAFSMLTVAASFASCITAVDCGSKFIYIYLVFFADNIYHNTGGFMINTCARIQHICITSGLSYRKIKRVNIKKFFVVIDKKN